MSSQWEKNTKKTITKKKTCTIFIVSTSLEEFCCGFFFPRLFFGCRDFSDVFCYGQEAPRDNPLQRLQPDSRYVPKPASFFSFFGESKLIPSPNSQCPGNGSLKKSLGMIWVFLFCMIYEGCICPTFLWLFDLILYRKRSRWIYSPDPHVKKSAQRQFAEVWKEVGGIYENSKPKYDPMIPVRSVQ